MSKEKKYFFKPRYRDGFYPFPSFAVYLNDMSFLDMFNCYMDSGLNNDYETELFHYAVYFMGAPCFKNIVPKWMPGNCLNKFKDGDMSLADLLLKIEDYGLQIFSEWP